jgi:hypothetical protein
MQKQFVTSCLTNVRGRIAILFAIAFATICWSSPFFCEKMVAHAATAPAFVQGKDNQVSSGLRHSVNYGFDEGVRSGIADRRDPWAFNYRDSFAYQDANFGYAGYYVDRDDYNFYFREGFRRGYEDGFYSRNQYGHYSNGSYSVPVTTLSVILDLRSIH